MATTQQAKYREHSTQEVNIRVDNHETDLTGTTVYAYAYPEYTERPEVELGRAEGTAAGVEFVIAIDPDLLEPGTYDVEIIANDSIVYPVTQDEELTLIVLNAKRHD